MLRIVSNTGPLIALANIDQFDLFRQLFEEILIPLAVRTEVLAGGEGELGVAELVAADLPSSLVPRQLWPAGNRLLPTRTGAAHARCIFCKLTSTERQQFGLSPK